MFASLRTRLWMSYALLVAVLLLVMVVGLAFALLQTPRLLYPDVVFRMRLASETLQGKIEQSGTVPAAQIERFLQKEASLRDLRFVLVNSERKVTFDTGGMDLPLSRFLRSEQLRPIAPDQARTIRPRAGGVWLIMTRHLQDGSMFLVLSPAPALPLRALFRDQFVSSFLYGGAIALGLAFLLSIIMGRWITAPIRRMVGASRAVALGQNATLPVEGPVEMQALAKAMNEMSQRVQVAQQSQRDFVANVSHELKTPLTSIQGFSQAIMDGAVQTPEALRQAAQIIFEEANRMHGMVIDLLSLARLESGTANLEHAQVDLSMLLRGIALRFDPQAKSSRVTMDFELADLTSITGDGERLAQVFSNLVDNAIKFTPPGGKVRVVSAVDVSEGENAVVVRVADTGPGIPSEDRGRIFERFYQVDKSRRGGEGRGTGLGLAIARQIVLAHGGKIWIESEPGQGSCFVVKIPLAPATNSTVKTMFKGKR